MTTTAPAKDRLIAAASLLGLQESVQLLSGQLQEEITRTILRTPLKDLPAALSRILGPSSARTILSQTSVGDLHGTLSRVLGLKSGNPAPTVMAPVKRGRGRPRKIRPIDSDIRVTVRPIAVVKIVEKPEGFFLELNDGRTYRSTRRRDLVRRAKQLGLSIPG